MKSYEIKPKHVASLKHQLLSIYEAVTNDHKEVVRSREQDLAAIASKLETVEERFALDDIDRNVYEKIASKLRDESRKINDELDEPKRQLSNPELFVQTALKICADLSNLWLSKDFDGKLKLQKILFPTGIIYSKDLDNYRTNEVNVILELTRSLS